MGSRETDKVGRAKINPGVIPLIKPVDCSPRTLGSLQEQRSGGDGWFGLI